MEYKSRAQSNRAKPTSLKQKIAAKLSLSISKIFEQFQQSAKSNCPWHGIPGLLASPSIGIAQTESWSPDSEIDCKILLLTLFLPPLLSTCSTATVVVGFVGKMHVEGKKGGFRV